jgi:hypothetical protein
MDKMQYCQVVSKAAQWLRRGLLCMACAMLLPCAGAPAAMLFGPYKDINMAVDPQAPVASTRVNGAVVPLASDGRSALPAGIRVLTLAFASGECGTERWGELDGQQVADANIAALQRAGIGYVISTGGEGHVFTCASHDGMDAFIARYASAGLLGLDFDIEAGQTAQQIADLASAARHVQDRHPQLRISFTLATLAASDGSGAGLNAHGQRVLLALKAAGMRTAYINLMVMNYGPAQRKNCVVRADRCDMAASARQAVENLHRKHGVPYARIEVTAMPGVNDVVGNVFTTADAYRLARFARQRGLAGLHYWSLDRDSPCADNATAVSPTCSSLNQVPASGFALAFARGLR